MNFIVFSALLCVRWMAYAFLAAMKALISSFAGRISKPQRKVLMETALPAN
jgi:hypothetical protein